MRPEPGGRLPICSRVLINDMKATEDDGRHDLAPLLPDEARRREKEASAAAILSVRMNATLLPSQVSSLDSATLTPRDTAQAHVVGFWPLSRVVVTRIVLGLRFTM